jgi:hypothetical protein
MGLLQQDNRLDYSDDAYKRIHSQKVAFSTACVGFRSSAGVGVGKPTIQVLGCSIKPMSQTTGSWMFW